MPTDLPPRRAEKERDAFTQHTRRATSDVSGLQENNSVETNQEEPKARLPRKRVANDGASFRILSLSGIPVRLHWTFFVFLAYVAWGGPGLGLETGHASTRSLLTVVALFTCVVLHEMGHALTARSYGIQTTDIVLYPIGGVARLETLPRPRQELWIALAGPAVNLLIAAGLLLWLQFSGAAFPNAVLSGSNHIGLTQILWANVFLAVFNMIPAFPMDGGRVLRALLARKMDDVTATVLAARIGQGMALLLGLYSLWSGSLVLLFIALFVYKGAQQEAAMFQTQELISGHQVREAMMREFHTLSVGSTLREAADSLIAGSQQDFPIVHGGEVVGLLTRATLLQGLANQGPDAYVAGIMLRHFARVHPDEPLEEILPLISETGSMLVMQAESSDVADLIGMVTQENLYEFLMLSQAQKGRR